MKTKIVFKDFQIHNVPMETILLDESGKFESCIMLDDINEKRWKIVFKAYQALKLTAVDCVEYEEGYFKNFCYQKEGESFLSSCRYILEVIDSEWINELKENLLKNDTEANFMDKARHFVLPLYDYHIEIIAWDLELTEYKE